MPDAAASGSDEAGSLMEGGKPADANAEADASAHPPGSEPDPLAAPWWGVEAQGRHRQRRFARYRRSSPDQPERMRGRERRQAADNVLHVVDEACTWLPRLRERLQALANAKPEDNEEWTAAMSDVVDACSITAPWSPSAAADEFRDRDRKSEAREMSARGLVGEHVEQLRLDLVKVGTMWSTTQAAGCPSDRAHLSRAAGVSLTVVESALRHALLLAFLRDADTAPAGKTTDLKSYCAGAGLIKDKPKLDKLDQDKLDAMWHWITHDRRQFGDRPLRLVLDHERRSVIRKPTTKSSEWWLTATAAVWGGLFVLLVVAGLFGLLDAANLTTWPPDAVPKLVVLWLFVCLGAGLHLASRSLSAINYDDPVKVIVASGWMDWLSLRWIGVLQLYVPIAFVLATLWGAGNIPGSFHDLSTAILAGYSADSLFRAALSRAKANTSSPTANPGNATSEHAIG
jgi:hypothetical protein